MKTSNTTVLAALIATAGFVVACSSDGTGAVPPGVYGGETAGQFGGAIGTTNSSVGGSVAAGGSDKAGALSPGGATGAAGSPVAGSTAGQAGSTAITTIPAGGSSAITTVPRGGSSGAGTTSPGSTAAGGNAGAGGGATAGGTTAAGGTTGAGGTKAVGGTTAVGGTSAAAGATGAGGTTTRTGGTTAAGGAGGSTGTGTGASNWWPTAFDANANPSPLSGKHNPGRACLGCHKTGGQGPAWLFGGTIYDQAGSAGVNHVQVGIKDGTKFFSAYSATNGNIWLPLGSNSINWATAEIRVRTAAGESTMTKTATSGDCNSCHDSTNRITMP
jgi:hypothetical protein